MAFVRTTPALPWSPNTSKSFRLTVLDFSLQSSRTDLTDNAEPPPPASTMRIAEIRAQLDELNIDYKDCFDKESIIQRLQDARAGNVVGGGVKKASDKATVETATTTAEPSATTVSDPVMTKDDVDEDVSTMSVKELRQELSRYNIRWAGLLEKADLIRAVHQARQTAPHFSVTGLLRPGQVTSLTADQVQAEIAASTQGSSKSTPLLLDVFAVWCGPCQFMAKQLQEAAQTWGDRVRVAKMDSDQHPQYAAQLKVQGLPTLILFHHGAEVARMEGALTKDQVVEWVERQL